MRFTSSETTGKTSASSKGNKGGPDSEGKQHHSNGMVPSTRGLEDAASRDPAKGPRSVGEDAAPPLEPLTLAGREKKRLNKSLAASVNSFAVALYRQLRSKKGNLFFSPFSVATTVAMAYAGSSGSTEREMRKALSLNLEKRQVPLAFHAVLRQLQRSNEKKLYELQVANKLFVQANYPIKEVFRKVMRRHFGSALGVVDFSKDQIGAAGAINAWVSKNTKGKIKIIVNPRMLSDLTRLVLANAIYFKGQWVYEFRERRTRKRRFYLSPEKKVKVDTMYLGERLRYGRTSKVSLLLLPYKGRDLSMMVVLPRKRGGLDEVERSLSEAKILKWVKKTRRRKVKVYLPKFKINWGASLTTPLKALGMKAAFSQRRADFRNIDGRPSTGKLYVSDVVHKAFVEVNEEGTEAAAATVMVMARSASRTPRPRIPVFRADHPFFFVIWDHRTQTALFLGRVADPR